MSRDFADFLAALNAAGARFVVIGEIAVLARIPYRTTRDIDVQIEPMLDNATRVREAVRAWSGIEPEYSAADFVSGGESAAISREFRPTSRRSRT